MAKLIKCTKKDGTTFEKYYETPSEKGERYAKELKTKTNSITGEALNSKQASLRMGYLQNQKESAALFRLKEPGYQRKKR